MKKLVLVATLLLALTSLSFGQGKENISQEQAWSIAKQAVIDEKFVKPDWQGEPMCIGNNSKDGSWTIVLDRKEKEWEKEKFRFIAVYLSRTGEVEEIENATDFCSTLNQ